MIKYILLLASIIPISLFAQNDAAAKLSHSEVVEVAGATAKTLTDRATTFMAIKKIEAKTVGNVMSGTGAFIVSYPSVKKGTESGHVKFNFKLMIKDGKYKMDMTDFRHEGIHGRSTGGSIDLDTPACGPSQITGEAWAMIKSQAKDQLNSFVKDLKVKMDKPVKAAAENTDF